MSWDLGGRPSSLCVAAADRACRSIGYRRRQKRISSRCSPTRRNRFGAIARRRYEALLIACLRDIAADPKGPGSVARPELGAEVWGYHLRHGRDRARTSDGVVRPPCHLLLFRATRPDVIGVGRVLYDGMELEQHLPEQ